MNQADRLLVFLGVRLDIAKKTQIQKFREAAKEAGTDESEERFNETLKGLAKSPREADKAGHNEPGDDEKPKH